MKILNFVFDVIPAVVVATIAVNLLAANVGGWVGDLKPAALPMVLTEAELVDDIIVFSGTSARIWPQCNPRRIEGFLGQRNGQNAPMEINWGPPIKRANGEFSFHGWTAEINDLNTFRFDTFSDVLHSCRIFATHDVENNEWIGGFELPFLVRTKFFR